MLEYASLVLWLPYIALLVHTIEELPEFSSWSTRHFREMSAIQHAVIQSIMLIVLLVCSVMATAEESDSVWIIIVAGFQLHVGLNALFHIVMAVRFCEYSPGMLTGIAVSLPTTLVFFGYVSQHAILTGTAYAIAITAGVLLAAAAVGTLFLPRKSNKKTMRAEI